MDKPKKCLDCQGNVFLTSVTFSVVNIRFIAVLVCSITNDNSLANGIAVSILIAFLLQAEKSRNQVGFSTTSYITLCSLQGSLLEGRLAQFAQLLKYSQPPTVFLVDRRLNQIPF